MPYNLDHETKIYWLNWKELIDNADHADDRELAENLYERTAEFADMIRTKVGEENLLDWAIDELLEERMFERTPYYRIKNGNWDWTQMVKDLLQYSKENPELIFMIVFIENETEEKTYMHQGRLTTILINREVDELIECY